jgi:hypothetical protein
MESQHSTTSSLAVYNPLYDTSILFPKGFWEPGWGSILKGFFGTGSFASGATASASFGPGPTAPISTWSTGIDIAYGTKNQFGMHLTEGAHTVLGIELRSEVVSNSFTGAASSLIGDAVTITGSTVAVTGAETAISGESVTIASPAIIISGAGSIIGLDISSCINAKGFDIQHPTKPDTHRLRYICLEGPEVGTYLRGKLINSNIIELPEYWNEKFIDPDSITVNLTPYGNYQELFVNEIKGNKIIIKNNSASKINCHYTVFAERKMKDKLKVEYEGQSPADYPGDNSDYSLAGWNYDRRFN